MAFKLDKDQKKERDALVERLRKSYAAAEDAVNGANEIIAAEIEKANEKVRAHNELAEEARTFVEGVAEEWRSDFDNKSEKWQEGDRGQEVDGAIFEWEGAEIDDLDELTLPDLELEGEDCSDDLANLPESV